MQEMKNWIGFVAAMLTAIAKSTPANRITLATPAPIGAAAPANN